MIWYYIIDQLWHESPSINKNNKISKASFNLSCNNYEDITEWTECQCYNSLNPVEISHSRPNSYLRHGTIQNSSSQCHNKMNRQIFLGYLFRRYSFQSKFSNPNSFLFSTSYDSTISLDSFLYLGCSCSFTTSMNLIESSNQKYCLSYCDDESDEEKKKNNVIQFLQQLTQLRNIVRRFDVVFIEKISNYEIIQPILELLLDSISSHGYLIIADTRPIYLHESVYPKPYYIFSSWLGDSWKVL